MILEEVVHKIATRLSALEKMIKEKGLLTDKELDEADGLIISRLKKALTDSTDPGEAIRKLNDPELLKKLREAKKEEQEKS